MYAVYGSGAAAAAAGAVRQAPVITARFDKEQAVGILQHLNTDELRDLLENNEKLETLVNDNPQIKTLASDKRTLVASNKSLCEYNLSYEPKLAEGKESLARTYERAAALHQNVCEKKTILDEKAGNTSLDMASAMLKTSAESLENETETLAEQYLDGVLEIDTFVEVYIPKRTLAHCRKIKAEKMAELMRCQAPPVAARVSNWSNQRTSPQHAPLPYGNARMAMPTPQAYLGQ